MYERQNNRLEVNKMKDQYWMERPLEFGSPGNGVLKMKCASGCIICVEREIIGRGL